MAKTIKTRIYELPNRSSGYMMLDGGPGVECGKLDVDDLKGQLLSNLAPEYSETQSYQKTDWCVHEGITYRATETITYDGTNPNQWDSTKWVQKEIVDNIPVIEAVYNDNTDKYDIVGGPVDLSNVSAAILHVRSHITISNFAILGSNVGYGYFAFIGTELDNHSIFNHEWNCRATSNATEFNYYYTEYDLSKNIAVEWSDSYSYHVGDLRTHWGILYRCIQDESGSSERDWNPSNWQEVNVATLLGETDALIPSGASSANQLVTQSDLNAYINGAFAVVGLTSGANPVPDVSDPSPKIIYLTKEAVSSKTDPYTEWIAIAQGTTPETYVWEVIGETSMSVFSGSTPGLVPTATPADANKALRGDGTWGDVSNATVSYDSVTEELSLDFSLPQNNGGN